MAEERGGNIVMLPSPERGINFIGHSRKNLPVLSLTFDGVSPSDIDLVLSMRGFCLRSGKHCAFLPVSRLAADGFVSARAHSDAAYVMGLAALICELTDGLSVAEAQEIDTLSRMKSPASIP